MRKLEYRIKNIEYRTMKIKKGDTVQILAGKDRTRRGKVIRVLPDAGKIVIEGLNLRKKHTRPRRQGEKGRIIDFPAPLPVSRVGLLCPHCQKVIRVGYRLLPDGKKERHCRKCQASIK